MAVSPIGTHVEVIMSLASTVSIGKKQDPVVLTDKAVAKVAELLAQETGDEVLALRVAVKPGGCSGFSYEMFFFLRSRR